MGRKLTEFDLIINNCQMHEEECRAITATMKNKEPREMMLRVADKYGKLAASYIRLAEWHDRTRKHGPDTTTGTHNDSIR